MRVVFIIICDNKNSGAVLLITEGDVLKQAESRTELQILS